MALRQRLHDGNVAGRPAVPARRAIRTGFAMTTNITEEHRRVFETLNRPIVEVSTRDPWWGARPVAERYEGRNVLGRLWMELRQQLRDHDPAARSGA